MDKHCRICHNISCSNHGKSVSFLGDGWKCNYIPIPTNADRIRAMSDEELTDFLCDFRGCDTDENTCIGCKGEQYCRAGHPGTMEWLKQPAEGECL